MVRRAVRRRLLPVIRGPFIRRRDSDPARCDGCGRVVAAGELHVVAAQRPSDPERVVIYENRCCECAADIARKANDMTTTTPPPARPFVPPGRMTAAERQQIMDRYRAVVRARFERGQR